MKMYFQNWSTDKSMIKTIAYETKKIMGQKNEFKKFKDKQQQK